MAADGNTPVDDQECTSGPLPEEKDDGMITGLTVDDLMSELAQARLLAEERLDQLKRCQADLDNVIKRAQREREDQARFASEALMKRLLGFLDSLEQAAKHDEGSRILNQQLLGILKSEGLEPIDALGSRFDPYLHEAMMQVESSELDEGTIAQEFQRGYTLNSKVIRTSKVAVVKPKC